MLLKTFAILPTIFVSSGALECTIIDISLISIELLLFK